MQSIAFYKSGVLVMTHRKIHVEILIDYEPRQANHSQYSSIEGIVWKETVCCVGGKVKH